ncbi:MAG: DUF4258 domain-containing protein [Nanoarchaeota archaeon]
MIISDHAKEEMEASGITEEEVKACLENGELEIKQIVDGETRYGNKIMLKDKTIIVIYTYRGEEKRIITAYPVWRKKKW